jgi:release factor glutamine methyltransferase
MRPWRRVLTADRADERRRYDVRVTLHERVTQATHALVAAGYAEAEAAIDAEVLARHALAWTREQMLVRWREPMPADFDARYTPLIARRMRHEPVAYIIGHREFWNLDIAVTRDTLIPRPETELIVEETLTIAARDSAGTIVDVGTGSGCLAVAIAHELRQARVLAIDVSVAALDVARRNAMAHHVADRITFIVGSVLEPVSEPVDVIVSNPPYVPLADAPTLQPDVRDYEPAVALFSGIDGLATIRALLIQSAAHLRSGGWLIFEFGYGQADAIERLVERADAWQLTRLRHDLQGIPRTAVLQRR